MRNRLHVLGFCQQMALEGMEDEKFILKAVAAEFPTESLEGGDRVCGVKRDEIKATFKAMADVVAQAQFPVERANLALDTKEILLRADFLMALDKLPLDDPRDVRELHALYRSLASQGGQAPMQQALDALMGGDLAEDAAALKERMLKLYPLPELDDAAPGVCEAPTSA